MREPATSSTELVSGLRPGRRWYAMSVLLSGTLLANLDVFVVVVAVPAITRDLHASPAQQLALVADYELTYGVGLLAAGRLGDRFGAIRVFAVGMALFTAASVACGLAPTASVLVTARAVQGVGTALLVPQVYGGLQALFTAEERRAPLAISGAVMGIGAISGQLLGGLLLAADVWGLEWRSVFLINLPIGAAALIALRWVPQAPSTAARSRFDVTGTVLAMVAAASVAIPLLFAPDIGWPLWAIAVGTPPTLWLLVRHQRRLESRGREPLVPTVVATNRDFRDSIVLVTVFNSSLNAFFLIIAVYAQNSLGYSPLATGALMIPLAGTFAVVSLLITRMGAGNEPVLLAGAVLTSIGYFTAAGAVAVWPNSAALGAALAVVGLGEALFITPMLAVALRSVPTRLAGVGAGLVSTAQQLGAAFGVCVFGALFYALRDHRTEPASTFAATTTAIALTAVLSAVLSARKARPPHNPTYGRESTR